MKNQVTKLQCLFIAVLVILAACKKADTVATDNNTTTTGNPSVDALINMHAPDGFNYRTDQEVQLNITILAPDNAPIGHIPVRILNKSEEAGGKVL